MLLVVLALRNRTSYTCNWNLASRTRSSLKSLVNTLISVNMCCFPFLMHLHFTDWRA